MGDSRADGSGGGRRREILEAAEGVFARRGYRGTTMADVAKAVGFTQPALYRYFPSKQALFMGALALRQEDIGSRYVDVLSADVPASEKLRRLVEATIDMAAEHPEMARLRLQAIALADEPEVKAMVSETLTNLVEAHRALFAQALEEGHLTTGLHPENAASTLAGLALYLYVCLALDLPDGEGTRAHDGARNVLDALLGKATPG